jgi:hypothetical protein
VVVTLLLCLLLDIIFPVLVLVPSFLVFIVVLVLFATLLMYNQQTSPIPLTTVIVESFFRGALALA